MKQCVLAMIVVALLAGPSMADELVFPTVTTGTMAMWLDAADAVYDASGQVTAWQDKTGMNGGIGGLFTVPTAVPGFDVTGPTIGTMADSDLPVVYFNGSSNVLRGEGAITNEHGAKWTFFFVFADVTNVRGAMDTGHNQHNPIRFSNDANRVANQFGDDAIGVCIDLADSAPNGVLFSFTHDGNSGSNNRVWLGYTNGVGGYDGSYATGESHVVTWAEPQFGVINGYVDPQHGPTATNWFKGGIAEVIVFKGVLSDDDRQAVEMYLMGKYAIVPEPATMTLLALGGLALLRRRK